MNALSATEVIQLWEVGRSRHPVDRALAMVRLSAPGSTRDELAALPLGRRDAQLMRLRQATFGDRLQTLATCTQCGERLEVELSCSALLAPAGAEEAAGTHTIKHSGYLVTFRIPDSFDVAAIVTAAEPPPQPSPGTGGGGRSPRGEGAIEAARATLLARCVLEASGPDGAAVGAGELPADVAEAVGEAMAELDPQAEVLLDMQCPQCGHAWQSALDITSVLWSEVSVYARRLLLEVDQLARAYGWREPDILALSPARRAAYLELVSR
jgi:hypothetical protein